LDKEMKMKMRKINIVQKVSNNRVQIWDIKEDLINMFKKNNKIHK
jgi:hypothetical protein